MRSIIQHFAAHLTRSPDHAAIIYQNRSYSYQILAEAVNAIRGRLLKMGLGQGDVCVTALDNSPEFAALYLAAADLGMMLAPVAGSGSPQLLETAIKSTGAKALIGGARAARNYIQEYEKHENPAPVAVRTLQHDDVFTRRSEPLNFNSDENQCSLDYILTMTSGSTGNPKPIVLTQGVKVIRSFAGAKELYGLDEGEVVLVASPMHHSLAQRLTLLPLMTGGTAVILRQFQPDAWLDAVERYRVTFTIAVSSHLEQLVDPAYKRDLSSLKCLVSSSALLRDDIKSRCLEVFRCDFHECYGASEVGIVTDLTAEDARTHLSTVGKALPYVDLKIVDQNKQEVKTGETGEIIAKTPTAFSRYYKQPEATAESVVDGYFYTGDLGRLDEDGFLYLSGRKKDIIIVGGTNVYPQDVEAVIARVPGIRETAVIGVEDAYFGEAVLAVLVTEADWDLSKVKQACFDQLADYQQPMAFETVEQLPRNAMGKLMKPALKERFKGYDATAGLRELMKTKN